MSRIVVIALALISAFTICRWWVLERDLTSFVCLAEDRTIPEIFDRPFNFQSSSYDGLYFFSYAHNPLAVPMAYESEDGRTVYHIEGIRQAKNYAFRKKRTGYSTVAHLLSGFGQSQWIPFALVLTNILAFILLAFGSWKNIKTLRPESHKWSYFVLLFAGSYICLARDLADMMAVSLAVLFVWLYKKQKIAAGLLVATVALFTKENILFLIYIPIGLSLLREWQTRAIPWKKALLWSVPLVCYALWNYHLYLESQAIIGYRSPSANFDWPLLGILQGLQGLTIATTLALTLSMTIYALVVEAGVAVWKHRKRLQLDPSFTWPLIFICYTLVSVCFSYKIYEDFWSLGRNLLPLQVAAFFTTIQLNGRVSLINTLLTAGTFLAFFILMVLTV